MKKSKKGPERTSLIQTPKTKGKDFHHERAPRPGGVKGRKGKSSKTKGQTLGRIARC